MKVTRDARNILVDGYLPEATNGVRIQIKSSRNERISRISDVSEESPDMKASEPGTDYKAFGGRSGSEIRDTQGGELWYPVVDVQLDWTMHGTAVVQVDAEGSYAINGMFHRKSIAFRGDIRIPVHELEHGITRS